VPWKSADWAEDVRSRRIADDGILKRMIAAKHPFLTLRRRSDGENSLGSSPGKPDGVVRDEDIALSLIVQDGGLYYYGRTMGFSFA